MCYVFCQLVGDVVGVVGMVSVFLSFRWAIEECDEISGGNTLRLSSRDSVPWWSNHKLDIGIYRLLDSGKATTKVRFFLKNHHQPRGVAVNHTGLWSQRRQFESARGYSFFLGFSSSC